MTTIELGVQSAVDSVLKLNRRGHRFSDVAEASRMIKAAGIDLGLQMMVGMYGSNEEFDRLTCRRIIELAPTCTRIYPTLVLKGTELERLYERGEYAPYSLEQAVMVSKDCLVKFRENNIRRYPNWAIPGRGFAQRGQHSGGTLSLGVW